MKKIPDFFSDGTYKGQMKNGVPHGKGIYTSKFETKSRKKNKYFYKGDWVNGKKHGKAEHAYHLPTYVITIKCEGELRGVELKPKKPKRPKLL